MYENDYMYAIERSPEYLAHYGIRGMKWGVKKARQSGDSAKLSRQYAKAQKKLAKLEKRASKTSKYARRAAIMGAGAAGAGAIAGIGPAKITAKGVGAANRILGGGAAAKMARLDAGKKVLQFTSGRNTIGSAVGASNRVLGGGAAAKMARLDAGKSAMNAVKKGAAASNGVLGGGAAGKMARLDAGRNLVNKGVSTNTLMRLGAGAVGAGLAVGAARNAYKAATAKKKAEKFRAAMNESFKGTKYANGGNSGNRQGKPRQGKKRRR